MNELIEKMNIEKDSNELKIYMFTVQTGGTVVEIPEDFKAVMAYTDSDAINMVKKDYLQGRIISVKQRAKIEVRKIIDAVNIQPAVQQETEIHQAAPPQEKTMQEFVCGMMLVADKFITNKRDRASLKRIIDKVKLCQKK